MRCLLTLGLSTVDGLYLFPHPQLAAPECSLSSLLPPRGPTLLVATHGQDRRGELSSCACSCKYVCVCMCVCVCLPAGMHPLGVEAAYRSGNFKKAVTVDFKEHPAQKVGTRSRGVSAQGLRQGFSWCLKSWNCQHFTIREHFSKNFPRSSRSFASGTPKEIPETATAFSSCLSLSALWSQRYSCKCECEF